MSTSRPIFDPVDTTFDPSLHSQKDDVESPSLTSGNALARFEFEPGRSRDGTKVLMVEWEDDASTRDVQGSWEISWEGKKTVLPAQESSGEPGEELPVNRIYFMLGPGVSVPTSVKLRKVTVQWRTNPLPAIFSPELGATARQAGKKGVLHTIWAKKRLQVLQKEIDAESGKNIEGIGLEMAAAEKEWIEDNFGVTTKPASISTSAQPDMSGPTSPRSPGGGRLMDKLKGLKLGTTTHDLGGRSQENTTANQNPLSPEGSDVAVGSFGAFAALKGMPPSSDLAAKPAQVPENQRRIAAQRPPDSIAALQSQGAEMASLNAFASGGTGFASMQPEDEKADGLFALPMSPRSPEMSKSPFSFGAVDTMKYTQGI
ncbi:hypothetical protein LTR78_002427 [Recurvomyces mirabilis]|uniref:Uncharacterized protein n=1 Tax=Recurvomyces mirabilis TaxID=574656 RepID=A0AAE1C489_9PEZI|nr:hypothetical protein LTR78_002427 [Recurvomyces mirabilis]KAK5157356.1 hypothetical protein LTS14_004121 [Recurvomyces mirabilis]